MDLPTKQASKSQYRLIHPAEQMHTRQHGPVPRTTVRQIVGRRIMLQWPQWISKNQGGTHITKPGGYNHPDLGVYVSITCGWFLGVTASKRSTELSSAEGCLSAQYFPSNPLYGILPAAKYSATNFLLHVLCSVGPPSQYLRLEE